MNSKQAKEINLPNLLSKLGYEPTAIKKGGNEYWYRSPFRKEKEASFHTSFLGGKWIWNDFGDIGGTVIDFVMRHGHFNGVSDALKYLEEIYPANSFKGISQKNIKQEPNLFSFQQQSSPQEEILFSETRGLEFIKAHQILNPVIYSYLESRGVTRNLADRYLREVKYRNVKTGKEFFAFGMRNESGGYEIRAATDEYSFKSALIKRDISLIRGLKKETNTVNIFEGMVDFVSLLVMLNTSNLSGDSIVMHSLSSFQRTVIAIKSMGYNTVNTFLDNNKAGQEHTDKFKDELGHMIISQSSVFAPYGDLNDALRDNSIPDFSKVKK